MMMGSMRTSRRSVRMIVDDATDDLVDDH